MNLLKEFAAHLLAAGKSARTVDGYSGQVKAFAKWLATKAGDGLSTATPLDLAEYKRELVAEGKKPSTVNEAIHALRAFYGFLGSDVAANLRPPLNLPHRHWSAVNNTGFSGRHQPAQRRRPCWLSCFWPDCELGKRWL